MINNWGEIFRLWCVKRAQDGGKVTTGVGIKNLPTHHFTDGGITHKGFVAEGFSQWGLEMADEYPVHIAIVGNPVTLSVADCRALQPIHEELGFKSWVVENAPWRNPDTILSHAVILIAKEITPTTLNVVMNLAAELPIGALDSFFLPGEFEGEFGYLENQCAHYILNGKDSDNPTMRGKMRLEKGRPVWRERNDTDGNYD